MRVIGPTRILASPWPCALVKRIRLKNDSSVAELLATNCLKNAGRGRLATEARLDFQPVDCP
eukprot:6184217-Pleurochrysis_carterae.AAC.2